jgi:hypothetical protein
MPDWNDISDRFGKTLAALDVEPLHTEAEKPFRLALVGAPGSGKTTLACAFAERVPGERGSSDWAEFLPEFSLPLSTEDVAGLDSATLIILLLDATQGDYAPEVAAADYMSYLGKPMLVCYSKMDLLPAETRLIRGEARWRGSEIVQLKAVHPETVREMLCPAILDIVPELVLSLARHLPAFRSLYADRLTERTALVNATYASASGLAESVPMLHMPLLSEDIEGISTNLAAMGYGLSLAYGLDARWYQEPSALNLAQQIGQWWQQFARQLMGILPLWGLESKVSLSYGGTLVTGRELQSWYDSGHVLSPQALHELCYATAAQARRTSHSLVAKARSALPAPQPKRKRAASPRVRLPALPKRRKKTTCPVCGRSSPFDAVFCAYCGASLRSALSTPPQGSGAAEAGVTQALPERPAAARNGPSVPGSGDQPSMPAQEQPPGSSGAS